MKYRNCFFDLYGTLADIHTDESKKELWKALAVWYQCHGAYYTPWQLRKDYVRFVQDEKKRAADRHPEYTVLDIRVEFVFERLFKSQGIYVSPDMAAETALYFRTLSRSYVRLYPGVRSMLMQLRARGCRCFLLTNAQAVFTMPELRLLGIADLFEGIVISSSEECAKPDPHFFQTALDRYRLDKRDCVMVGNDPRTDIAGANAIGMDSVYIHSNLSPERTGAVKSTYVIQNGDAGALKKILTG